MNEKLTLAHQKQDIVGRSVKTKLQKCTLQIYKWAILSGEEFMVLEKLVGEKFMIPCQNIHPWAQRPLGVGVIWPKDSFVPGLT